MTGFDKSPEIVSDELMSGDSVQPARKSERSSLHSSLGCASSRSVTLCFGPVWIPVTLECLLYSSTLLYG